MLCGEYRHNLDAKNRIFIPAKMREELGSPLVIAKSVRDKHLRIYSVMGWKAYIQPIMEQNRKLSEGFIRHLQSSLVEVTPDSQGRVVLPQELIDFAGIEKNAVIVGCLSWGEIWSENRYGDLKANVDPDAMAAELEALGL